MGILDYRFRSSIPSLQIPLSNASIQVQPRDCPRMAWGQGGSLFLPCTTLAFATPRTVYPDAIQTRGSAPRILAELPIPGKVCGIALKRAPREARRPVLGRLRYLRSGVGDGLSIEHPARALGVELLLPFRHHDSGHAIAHQVGQRAH